MLEQSHDLLKFLSFLLSFSIHNNWADILQGFLLSLRRSCNLLGFMLGFRRG
jgi:hypothetical protein